MSGTPTGSARFSPSLGLWSLGALLLGVVLGVWGSASDSAAVARVSAAVEPLGTLWVNALQMVVIPLVVTQLLAAIVRPGGEAGLGTLGGKALALFLTMLAVTGLATLVVTRPLLGAYHVAPEVVAALNVQSVSEATLAAAREAPITFGEWLENVLPRNPFEAAARGDILQILVVTILGALAIAKLPPESRNPIAGVVRGLADATMILVSWILKGTPVGVFALMLALSLSAGIGAVSLILWYVIGLSTLLLLATGLLYPLTVALGRTTLRRFARAAAPAQLVAVGTQSSLASLPALIEGAKEHLDLPERATGFVLPLCVSTYKLNQAIYPLFMYLLLAHFFSIPLGVGDVATFMIVSTLLSFGVAGVPRGGGSIKTLPLFLAAGIPIEAVALLEAVKTIPDIFMTLLNVTADMSAATILSRDARASVPGSSPLWRPAGRAMGGT